jgi:Putative collagen-binding domain of a collagenase
MSPRNEAKESGERVYVLAEAGKQYMIYAAAGGRLSVVLADGLYAARRYDPRTGEDVALAEVKGGVQSFTLPDGNDWVIYLRAKIDLKGKLENQ